MQRVRYKKKKYRSGRIKAIVLIAIAVVVVLVVLFLAIGISFANKTKDYEIPEDDFVTKSTDSSEEKTVASVQAYPLPLLEDGSSFASRLAGIDENAQSVCISLNKPDGTLLYRSSLASKLSYLSVESDASSIKSYVDSISDEDLYITATLYIPTLNDLDEDDELMADVELSIWGSIVCEAIRAGVNDVLLIAKGADAEDAQKLAALAERIHITEESATVGLCIPNSFFEAEKSASLIDSLSKKFDYLALDTTSTSGEGTLLENIEAAISDKQLQLMYYKMRVLLPRGASAEELAKLAEIVTRYSIVSWQAVPN